MLRHKTPEYMRQIIEPHLQHPEHRLRNRRSLEMIHTRTEFYYNTFLPKTIRDYNQLEPDDRNPNLTVAEFKSKLGKPTKVPNWYVIGDRKLTMIQSQLRMKCSSLKSDLYNLNIIQDNKCDCSNAEENAHHFFLVCPLYVDIRENLIENLNDLNFTVTLQNLLFGDPSLRDEKNVTAMLFIQDYILDSRRFI